MLQGIRADSPKDGMQNCQMISAKSECKKMGGSGSGRGYQGGKDTHDNRHADAGCRRQQRDGLLTPGRALGWQWTRDCETVASIQVRAETDRIILNYRHKNGGGDW
jgi:hypothetical protein